MLCFVTQLAHVTAMKANDHKGMDLSVCWSVLSGRVS